MKQSKVIMSLVFSSLAFYQPYSPTLTYAKSLVIEQENTLAPIQQKETFLEVDKPVERELKGDQSHNYSISCKANDYLNLSVEQKGIDVVVKLFSPSGELLREVDSPNGDQGREPLDIVITKEGIYRLEIASLEKDVKPGQYQVTVKELRLSTENDKEIVKANKLFLEVLLLANSGKNNQALPLATEVAEIRQKILGENHPETIATLNVLAQLYYSKGDLSKAEALLVDIVEKRRNTLGEKHPSTIASLNNLANFYDNKGDYSKAESLSTQVLELRKSILGDNNAPIAVSINNLAGICSRKGDYAKAEVLYLQALDIRKRLLGENHVDTATSIDGLASLYYRKGDFSKAEPLYLQALDIRKKLLGEKHTSYIGSLNNLGLLYERIGNYAKSEAFYLEAFETEKKAGLENTLPFTILINNLALLYFKMGDYAKSEIFYIQALESRKKFVGENHPDVANLMNNLALLYVKKGDYAKSEVLYTKALETRKKLLGENHPDTATSMDGLAVIHEKKGEFDKAEALYLQALEIRKKALGENNVDTSDTLNNLSIFYLKRKNFEKAEPLCKQALEIRKNVLGKTHPRTVVSLNNLASIFQEKEEFDKAESFYLEALEINRKILGESHPNTATILDNLSELYENKQDYTKAIKYRREANDAREKELTRNLALGSERQKQRYLQFYAGNTDITLSLHTKNAPNNPQAIELAITEVLRRKGRSLDVVNQNIETLRKRSNPEDVAILNELSDKKSLLSNFIIQGTSKLSPDEYKKKLRVLQEEIERLEFKISEKSIEFSTQVQPITLSAIQKAIPSNTTLAEFAVYRDFDVKTEKFGKARYVVYLLDSQGTPRWADLGEAEVIDNLVDQLRDKLRNKLSSVNDEIKPLARELDKLTMQPVRKLTAIGNKLLIAPDGKLNLIPFESLVDERGKFLVESLPLSYLTSGRDLLRLKTKIDSQEPPVIIGNPDFGLVDPTSSAESETRGNIFSQLYFTPLKATEIEAKAIKKFLPTAKVLLHKEANEQALKSLNAPSILHIATHGFFLPANQSVAKTNEPALEATRIARRKNLNDEEQNEPIIKIGNPLLRSGIVLAGANINKTEENNGIFTALKATTLNLWGTKVVILSACDTGVGEVKSGDGIYGLRRALVLAGSETQMMSLWPVSDNGTKDLMISYYSKLKKGMGRSDALRQTQLELLRTPTRSHPFYWASFVQSGQWDKITTF